MASLKDMRVRIASTKATQKITKAMQMVAASKLRRAQTAAEAARPYAEKMAAVIGNIAGAAVASGNANPLLAGTGSDKTHLLLVCTGERGLCGAFNSAIVRRAREHAQRLMGEGKEVKFFCVGRKGYDLLRRTFDKQIVEHVELRGVRQLAFSHADEIAEKVLKRFSAGEFDVCTLFFCVGRKGYDLLRRTFDKQIVEHVELRGVRQLAFSHANEIAEKVLKRFAAGEFDVCTLFFSRFRSVIAQIPTAQQIIPLVVEAKAGEPAASYEYEPEEDEILGSLLPRNIAVQIFRALLENNASFYGAQMSAMDNATRNAGEMIRKQTLTYNRTRQAMITKELIEIISGAEAL